LVSVEALSPAEFIERDPYLSFAKAARAIPALPPHSLQCRIDPPYRRRNAYRTGLAIWLLLPYLFWVTFAVFLNLKIVRLNRPFGKRA
jgi:hypothetical protein